MGEKAKLYTIKGGKIKPTVEKRDDIRIALDWNVPEEREIWVNQLRFQGTHACFKMATDERCPADAKMMGALAAPFISSVLGWLHDRNWEAIYERYPDIKGQALSFNCSEGLITSDNDPNGEGETEKI